MKVPNKKRTQNKSEFLAIRFGSKCTIHDNALVVNCEEEEEAGEIKNKNKKPTTIISLLRKASQISTKTGLVYADTKITHKNIVFMKSPEREEHTTKQNFLQLTPVANAQFTTML
jgi:hypothetical protein